MAFPWSWKIFEFSHRVVETCFARHWSSWVSQSVKMRRLQCKSWRKKGETISLEPSGNQDDAFCRDSISFLRAHLLLWVGISCVCVDRSFLLSSRTKGLQVRIPLGCQRRRSHLCHLFNEIWQLASALRVAEERISSCKDRENKYHYCRRGIHANYPTSGQRRHRELHLCRS